MTDSNAFRPDSAREAAERAAAADPAREFLDESVARQEPWPDPLPGARQRPEPEPRRGVHVGDAARVVASLAVTAYVVDTLTDPGGAGYGG